MPSTAKGLHHRGDFDRRSRLIRAAANADPDTRCWKCHRTLAEHPPHKTGSPAEWTAGHVRDGEIGGLLLPEASTCNKAGGARITNAKKKRTTLTW